MSVDKNEITHIAKLAKLHLTADSRQRYGADLRRILVLVEQMNAVQTDGVQPLAHPLDISARLRPDVVAEKDQRDRFQQGAPLVRDGYYLVPKVID